MSRLEKVVMVLVFVVVIGGLTYLACTGQLPPRSAIVPY